ncbi:hypothetical protein ACLK1X_04105 [Escherichia coli]
MIYALRSRYCSVRQKSNARSGGERSPDARQASEIRRHVLNTTRLVNNLLDMARIQSGGFNLKKEWLTLEEVVGSALQMLEPGSSSPINLSLPEPLTLITLTGHSLNGC